MWCNAIRSVLFDVCLCVKHCKMWCDVGDVRILVSIVVSIPACHAGDPGSIPGREAFSLWFILFFLLFFVPCSSIFALDCPPLWFLIFSIEVYKDFVLHRLKSIHPCYSCCGCFCQAEILLDSGSSPVDKWCVSNR